MDSDKGYFTMDRYNGFTTKLQPIETAPRDGTYIILFGPSGYVGTPLRCEVCSYKPKYRPLQPWVDYSGESFEDSGEPATYWIPIPTCEDNLPEKGEDKPSLIQCILCGAVEHSNHTCPKCHSVWMGEKAKWEKDNEKWLKDNEKWVKENE